MSDRRTRVAKAGALTLLVFVGTCAIVRSKNPPPLPTPPPIVASPSVAEVTPPAPRRELSPITPMPPVIDAITLEKDEVCEGEENLVTVRAHTGDGNDPFLHYRVGAESGAQVALRAYLNDHGRPTEHRISVFSKNNVVTTASVPSYRVKACEPSSAVVIEHRLLPNATREFEFVARVVTRGSQGGDAAPPPSFRPQAYAWTFGDGGRENGRAPVSRHAFGLTDGTLYSQYIVAVEVLGEDGRVVKGRRTLELLNPAFEAFAYKGVVVLMADLDPRFPVLSPTGVVEQGVRLTHARPSSVFITKATMTARFADPSRRSIPEPVPPASVLGIAEIPAERGISFRVTLDTRAEPDVVARDYALEGRSHDGHPVRGSFSIMKPPALPTKEHHDKISDPVLLAKVKIAREVLHREFVTDEDLSALERAGQFEGLTTSLH